MQTARRRRARSWRRSPGVAAAWVPLVVLARQTTTTTPVVPRVLSSSSSFHEHESDSSRCPKAFLKPAWQKYTGATAPYLQPNRECARRPGSRTDALHPLRDDPPLATTATYTMAMLYYCDDDLLRRHLAAFSKLAADVLASAFLLVVDDASPVGNCTTAAEVFKNDTHAPHGFDAAVYRIRPDLVWNIGGARNLAALVSPTSVVLFTDIDVQFPPSFFASIAAVAKAWSKAPPRRYWVLRGFKRQIRLATGEVVPHKPHPAMMLTTQATYWHVGGCDEDFVGAYGMTDPHFKWRVSETRDVETYLCEGPGPSAKYTRAKPPPKSSKKHPSPVSLDIPPVLVIPPRPGEHRSEHNADHNKRVYEAKTHEKIPWAATYLRFDWDRVF